RVSKARDWLQRAVTAAARSDVKGYAGAWSGVDALREALFGDVETARRQAHAAVEFEDGWETRALAGMAFAYAGDATLARESADALNAERPSGTLVQNYWIPVIRAKLELDAGQTARAIDLLRAAEPYELADTRLPLLPSYVRGEALLRAHD